MVKPVLCTHDVKEQIFAEWLAIRSAGSHTATGSTVVVVLAVV